jgi:2'-5' RNA ligase
MTEPQVRAFIAVDLPADAKGSLASTIELLQATLPGHEFGWVRSEAIHLTLKFLGNVDESRVPTISEAVSAAVEDIAPFDLRLDGTGTFPPRRRPSVVWAGLNGDLEALLALQAPIESAMASLGFASERRDFRPHLTLARIRSRLSDIKVRALGNALGTIMHGVEEAFTVDEVRLIRSELLPDGARYSTIGTAKLSG